jgi:hypothetical protein
MRNGLAGVLVVALLSSACATLSPEEKAAVARGTPMLEKLLGTPMPELPERSAIAVAVADSALAAGETARAVNLLEQALEMVGPDAQVCVQRGSLQYLGGLVAQYAGGAATEHGWTELRSDCIGVEVAGADLPYQTFFRYLASPVDADSADLEAGGESSSSPSKLAEDLWRQGMVAAAPDLPAGQQQILTTYADWLDLKGGRPIDRCDREFHVRQLQKQKVAAEWLTKAGRPDLAVGYFNVAVLDQRGNVNGAALSNLEEWAAQPENRWLMGNAVGGVLATLRFGADDLSPLLTSELCDLFYADLLRQVEGDRFDGFNGRNATRLLTAFNGSGACLGQSELVVLVDAAFDAAMADGQGRIGVLQVAGGLVYNLGLQLFDNRSESVWGGLEHLFGAMGRVEQKLGDSNEDRALRATMQVVMAMPAMLQGQSELLLGTMSATAKLYDEVLSTPISPEDPELLRILPALRLSNLAMSAALTAFVSEPANAIPIMRRLRKTLPEDLAALFAYFEEPDQSAKVIAIIDGALAGYVAYDKTVPDGEAVLAALRTMGPGEEPESGWWAVGLDVMRVVAWDGLAILAVSDDPGSPLFKQALAEAELVSSRMVGNFLVEMEVPGTLGRILRLLPALHRGVPAFLDGEMSTIDIAAQVARVLEEPLDAIVEGVSQGSGGAGHSQVAALLNELLAAVAGVGLEKLILEPKVALAAGVKILEQRLGNYPPDVRVFMELVAAVGHYYATPDKSAEVFSKVAENARTALPRVGFVPTLLEASLRLADDAPTEDLIVLVNRALAYGLTATRCGQSHAVHSLLPARMWLREATGDHAAAQEDYEAYVLMLQGGFEGDVLVSCQLRSYAETFVFSMDISNSTAAFMLPGKNEGTFNVGIGAETGRAGQPSGDELDCDVIYTGVPRYDRIMEAHLAFGAYELLNDNPAEAQLAMLRAAAVGRQMLQGNAVTMGRNAGGAQQGATRVSLIMIAYTSLLARLHGQSQVANILEEQGAAFAASREGTTLNPGVDHEVPIFFQRITALQGFGELVTGWHEVRIEKESKAYLNALKTYRKKRPAFPRWSLEMAVESLKERLPSTGRGVYPEELPPSKSAGDLAKHLTTWRNLLIGTNRTGKLPDLESIRTTVRELAKLGLYGELAGPLIRMVVLAWRAKDPAMAIKLLELGLNTLSPTDSPVVYLDAMILAADLLIEIDSREKAVEALVKSASGLGGYHSSREEIDLLYRLLQLAGPMGDGSLVWDVVRKLTPMMRASSGADSLAYYTLVALDVGFRFMAELPVSEAAIRRLDVQGKAIADGEGTRHYFQLLRQTSDPVLRKSVSEQFLVYVLQNGPPPELPQETSGAESGASD